MSDLARLRTLSIAEVHELTGIPKSRIYELIAQGDLPALRIGDRTVRVREATLMQWLDECESQGETTWAQEVARARGRTERARSGTESRTANTSRA